jgi:hypothetical protein
MRAWVRWLVCLWLGLGLGLAGCARSPAPNANPENPAAPDGVEAMEKTAEGARFFTGPLPVGWQVLHRGGAKVAFHNTLHNQIIMVNVLYAPNRQANLTALRNHLLFDMTDRKILENNFFEVDDREALWTVVDGRLDGAEIRLAIVVVRIDSWVYDLVYVADPAQFDACLADFKKFVDAFHQQRSAEPGE